MRIRAAVKALAGKLLAGRLDQANLRRILSSITPPCLLSRSIPHARSSRSGRLSPITQSSQTTVSNRRFKQLYTFSDKGQGALERNSVATMTIAPGYVGNRCCCFELCRRQQERTAHERTGVVAEAGEQPIRPVYAVYGDDSYLIRESIRAVARAVLPDEDERERASAGFRARPARWPMCWTRSARSPSFRAGGW